MPKSGPQLLAPLPVNGGAWGFGRADENYLLKPLTRDPASSRTRPRRAANCSRRRGRPASPLPRDLALVPARRRIGRSAHTDSIRTARACSTGQPCLSRGTDRRGPPLQPYRLRPRGERASATSHAEGEAATKLAPAGDAGGFIVAITLGVPATGSPRCLDCPLRDGVKVRPWGRDSAAKNRVGQRY